MVISAPETNKARQGVRDFEVRVRGWHVCAYVYERVYTDTHTFHVPKCIARRF